MRLKGVAQITQQRRDQAMTHRVPHRLEFGRQLARTFRSSAMAVDGQPAVVGSSSASRSASSAMSSIVRLRRRQDAARDPDSTLPPTPGLNAAAKWSSAIPVARATSAIPPCPNARASVAAHNRRDRSVSAGARISNLLCRVSTATHQGYNSTPKKYAFNLLRCLS